MKNVSTLTTLLVCALVCAHATPYNWGWKNFQSSTRLDDTAGKSVVENWQSVCEELCSYGYGGPTCGSHCDYRKLHNNPNDDGMFQDMCPILCINGLGELKCLCFQNHPLLKNAGLKENRNLLCNDKCVKRNSTLKGCTACPETSSAPIDDLIITFDPNIEISDGTTQPPLEHATTSASHNPTLIIETTTIATAPETTTTTTAKPLTTTTKSVTTTIPPETTPDWSELCHNLCRNGDGGALCNCDIPPFF